MSENNAQESINEKYEILSTVVASMQGDLDKSVAKGNKAAGVRLRASIRSARELLKQMGQLSLAMTKNPNEQT
jgi:hypothetical protein